MSSNAPRNLKLRKILFVSLLGLICIVVAYSVYQQKKVWAVPEEVKKLKNPLQPSESNRKAAMALYQDKCAECHGDAGKGDGPEAMMHDPAPADLTDARHMNTLTDGEIFYQISEGRKPMPSFRKRLTEEQRWQLVLLVRSFAQSAATPEQKPDGGKKPASSSKN